MGKRTPDATLDAQGNFIKTNISRQIACSAEPTTYAEATATYALADVAMVNADITLANGDVSGRKYTHAAKSMVPVDATGDATHIATVDDTGTALLEVTTCDTKAITVGDTVNMPAWKGEIADPA